MATQNSKLSNRQTEVIRLISRGKTDKEIATLLGIAESTVSSHVSSILMKLRAVSRAQAAFKWRDA